MTFKCESLTIQGLAAFGQVKGCYPLSKFSCLPLLIEQRCEIISRRVEQAGIKKKNAELISEPPKNTAYQSLKCVDRRDYPTAVAGHHSVILFPTLSFSLP